MEHLIARETLVAAHTAQEHLEAKVKDLSKQLSAKEDRLNIYEGPRLPTNAQGDAATRDDATHNHGLSQEKKLEIEISQLKYEDPCISVHSTLLIPSVRLCNAGVKW